MKNHVHISKIVVIILLSFITFSFIPISSNLDSDNYQGQKKLKFSYEILFSENDNAKFKANAGNMAKLILQDMKVSKENGFYHEGFYMFLIGICIVMSIYNFTLYNKRDNEKSPLLLGIFCLLLIIRLLVTDNVLILRFIPFISWKMHTFLYSCSFFTYIPTYIIYLGFLYPKLINEKILLITKHSLIFYVLYLAITPVKYHFIVFVLYQSITLLLMIHVVTKLFKKCFYDLNSYLLIFLSALTLLITNSYELLRKYVLNNNFFMVNVGFLIFLLLQSYLIANKYVDSFNNIENLSEKLKRHNKLKDEFLLYISKELKSPMNSIIGLTESIVSDENKLSSNQLLDTKLINYSAVQLSKLVDDILDYSKLNNTDIVLDKHPVNIKQLADMIFLIAKGSLTNKNLILKNDISNDLPLVYADINRLQQIINNLLENAIKYTSEGIITLNAVVINNFVKISVEDTGIGIPIWKVNSLFDAYTIKNSQDVSSTTGLTLHLTKKLIELHGGSINVSSHVGKGSKFSFTMPLYEENTEVMNRDNHFEFENIIENYSVAKSSMPVNPQEKQKNYRILIVDNELPSRKVVENHLLADGYSLTSVSSGKEAMEIISNEDALDLVILNLFIPDMIGYELCSNIRNKKSLYDLPILMLTSSTKTDSLLLSFESGANDYLIKPVDKVELLSRVKTLIKLKHYVKESLELHNQISYTTKKVADLTDDINKVRELDKLKTEFFSNISHELKTPLNVIWTSVQLLKSFDYEGYQNSVSIPRYLNIMNQNCLRLIRLINNIIDITKIDGNYLQVEMSNNDIIFTIEEISLSVVNYAESLGLNLIFDTEIEEKYMAFDQDKIERIILNLLSNAIKFTPKGGTIEVLVKEIEDNIRIIVKDSGIGIPEDKLKVIFDRFMQVDKSLSRKTEGSGIGLSLVKSLVELHGGTVKAESTYGSGSSFIIDLPVRVLEDNTIPVMKDKLIPPSNKIDRINIEFSDIYTY
ncbi:His Kinase A (phospho-acceptor) domain-containing protein [Clostridium amylolyticum]|uniref:Stage 0 sporulation protein A homolog n=1 Tax=Clostridium amylolyticum TaxID=1121298 RepID=A0A1M6IDX6_9CLOT|nr:ATP-binding protein [Clostridium amylolyticum]SHJ32655.1 His Kinase A (phospho-acceptor) domain-containing protein [Clostridium amylolyticum]